MSSRAKSKQAPSKGSKEDRISELPDLLICHILDHLSTEEAVRTSFFSTRWRNLWLWIPNMELDSRKFQDINAFVSFGDRFFDSIRVSSIRKLNLVLGRNASTLDDESHYTSWIEAAIKRKIQHLHVRCSKEVSLTSNPLRLYSCETLVCLRLYGVMIVDDEVFDVLPCLKTMCLDNNRYPNEATLKKLISTCPVLESLKIVASDIDTKVFRVHSLSLKSLTIERGRLFLRRYTYDDVPGVVIDAPLLRCLSIDDRVSESFVVNNLESHAKLDISLSFGLSFGYGVTRGLPSIRSSIHNFLLGISSVREITISSFTFKVHTYMYNIFQCMHVLVLSCKSLINNIFFFFCGCIDHLSILGTRTAASILLHVRPVRYSLLTHLRWLETFLESCPNLKSLILVTNLL